jgi:hypothetical protein
MLQKMNSTAGSQHGVHFMYFVKTDVYLCSCLWPFLSSFFVSCRAGKEVRPCFSFLRSRLSFYVRRPTVLTEDCRGFFRHTFQAVKILAVVCVAGISFLSRVGTCPSLGCPH